MTRDEFLAGLKERNDHWVQTVERAVTARLEFTRVDAWDANAKSSQSRVAYEKAHSALQDAETKMAAAREEFGSFLFDHFTPAKRTRKAQ
jgi:hypothetical protein